MTRRSNPRPASERVGDGHRFRYLSNFAPISASLDPRVGGRGLGHLA
jgi:hypothetical protein